MKPWLQLFAHGARTLFSWIFSFALWTFWLALVLLLVLQLYIVSANELAIPDFALRQLEARLAQSGLRATFSRTSFDPTGCILIENVRLSVPAYAEPVITARSVFVRLNPLALVVGNFEPRDVRITNATATVPAMLSPSGRGEEIVRGLDATFAITSQTLTLSEVSARVAGVTVSASGTLLLARSTPKPAPDAIADFLANRFPALCQQAIVWNERLASLDAPVLQLDLSPSESGAISIQITALARAARIDAPFAAEAANVRATTRLLLFGDTPASHIELTADEVQLPQQVRLHGVRTLISGRFEMRAGQFDVREAMIEAESIASPELSATGVSAQVFPRPLPSLDGTAVARILGAPLSLRAETNLTERTARVWFAGKISPRFLDVISQRAGRDVRKYFDFEALTVERGEASFGAGWKFEKLIAQVDVPRSTSYGIVLEDGRASVELDPERFRSPEAYARVGKNFAHGSYDHHFKTHAYRFLLEGRVRPLEISGWFREWWPNFFRQIEFPGGPPEASADVAGSWREGGRSTVFAFVDASKSILRGTEFDRVRTRMFIRPAFYDGLEVLATRGEAEAQGRFTLVSDPATHEWQSLDLALDSTLDLKVGLELLGPAGARVLAPFKLAAPPLLKIRGSFAGPAAPPGTKEKLRIEARTAGEFRFHHFPLNDLSFIATIEGNEIVLDDVAASFGGGVASGHARVWGTGEQRRLGFDVSLEDASLGRVAAALEEFFAAQKNQPPAPPGKFVQEKANVRLDLAASAEGRYDNPFSFRGDGNAALRGAEIGEVPLLGQLSELLKFTALRFTEARANFKIDGAKLVFPKFELRGSNSAVDAHGEFALDRRELEFNAKIFPFQESENLLKTVVGAVLTPLSNAFEVKLSGTLAKPHWAFVIGPTNFLRALAEGGDATASKPTPPPTSSGLKDEKPSLPAAKP